MSEDLIFLIILESIIQVSIYIMITDGFSDLTGTNQSW